LQTRLLGVVAQVPLTHVLQCVGLLYFLAKQLLIPFQHVLYHSFRPCMCHHSNLCIIQPATSNLRKSYYETLFCYFNINMDDIVAIKFICDIIAHIVSLIWSRLMKYNILHSYFQRPISWIAFLFFKHTPIPISLNWIKTMQRQYRNSTFEFSKEFLNYNQF
jgi:hypothetical protein